MEQPTNTEEMMWKSAGLYDVQANWTWFIGMGAILILLGIAAISWSFYVTIATVMFFGIMLLIGGAGEIAHSLMRRKWGGFFIDLLTGLLYVMVGFMILTNPEKGAVGLTFIMTLFLFVAGIFRISIALSTKVHNWIWILLSGIINIVLGGIIWSNLPNAGLFLIGLFIGIEFLMTGWTLVMFGLAAKTLTPKPS